MNQSVTPANRELATKDKHVPEATAPLLTQSLEDRQHAERVESALRARGYLPLHGIRVSIRTRVVYLEGRVSCYYRKQRAQATALAVPGTDQIRSDLDVVQPK